MTSADSRKRGVKTAADVSRRHAMQARTLAERCPDDYIAEELESMAQDFDDNADYIIEEVADD